VLFDVVLGSAVTGGKAQELMCWACATNVPSRTTGKKLNPGVMPTQVSCHHNLSQEVASSVVRLCTAYHESNVVNFRDPVVNLALVAKPVLHEGWLPASRRQVPNLEKECSVLGWLPASRRQVPNLEKECSVLG
jgi:hypothetical protein